MLDIQRIRLTFEEKNFHPNSYIKRRDYQQFLNTLLDNNSIKMQPVNYGKEQLETKIHNKQVFKTFVQQYNREQQHYVNEWRNQHNKQTQHNVNETTFQNPAFNQHPLKFSLYADKQQFQQDLRLVTEPFGIRNNMAVSRRSQPYGRESGVENGDEHDDLKWILYLSVAFAAIQIIVIYGKYDFLNLIVLACLLSIYVLNQFDQVYIRLTLALLCISQILDVIWLFMYASQKWNPPQVGNNSAGQVSYLRFIVFFTICIIFLKIPLGYFLFKYRNASPDNKYSLNLLGGALKIVLSANKSNPITRGINNNIQN